MAPRRTTRNNINTSDGNSDINNNANVGNADLVALVTQQIAAAIPNIVVQVTQAMGGVGNAQASGSANATANVNPNVNTNTTGPVIQTCTLKHFNSCGPSKFTGSEGATGLLQWFESIENTFINSDCPENLKVRYAMSVLQKRALTWWNGEKRTRGVEAALSLPWEEVKSLMLAEFCPRNEMMKLEEEFWKLKQDSGENLAYTTRFHELSLLVPHHVTPLSRGIERYISGLPMQIQDAVWGSRPTVLEDAIRLAATLTDNHVKAGSLTRKGEKGENLKTATSETEFSTRKRKARNYAAKATPAIQAAPEASKKPYVGTLPQCATCKYHHPTTTPCRLCTNCRRYGHLANTCRAMAQPEHPTQGHCFECGDPGHYRNRCPKLINQAPPAAQARIFAITTTEKGDAAA